MSRTSCRVAKGNRSRPNSPSNSNNQALQDCLVAALERDERLVVLASSLATHTLPAADNHLAELARTIALRFPARFYGLGELLADMVPTSTRLAAAGLQPLVLMGSTDLARSYAGMSALCAQRLRVIFLLSDGPCAGQTWRVPGVNDLAILRTLPPLAIGIPAGPLELTNQLVEASQLEDSPVAICYHSRRPYQRNLPSDPYLTGRTRSAGVGKAVMLREGRELALLTVGAATAPALALAGRLEELGHQAAVVDVRWLRPLDEALITAVANHFPRLITLEEGGLEGGLGSAVLEVIEQRELYQTRLKRLELEARPRLSTLTTSVTAFLDTLQRDEGFLPPPLPGRVIRFPQPGQP